MIKHSMRATLALFIVTSICTVSSAQPAFSGSSRPASKPGGYASVELQQIYNQAVGTGYSVNSMNARSLNSARARNDYYGPPAPRPTGPGAPRIGLGVGASVAGKPFASYSQSPTVSPYLNLFREDIEGGGDLNYNTLVRPMLQQQQINQQVQRQNMEMARRLQAISAQSDFNPRGSESQFPTGHQTVYRYYGRFYPAMNARYRR
jgi:hypothetical protein